MSRPPLPEERGADLRPDPPTLSELKAAHDWRTEERADGRYVVDVCEQCGYERSAGAWGRPPDCEVREIPSRLTAKRLGLLPETDGARTDSMHGVPSTAAEGR
jgi:hypothetical protein